MQSLDALRADHWDRWAQQFDRLPELDEAMERGVRTVYGRGHLFDLRTYKPGKFLPGRRHSPEPFPIQDNFVYQLDEMGRPVHMSMRHSVNGIDWRGMYRYADDEVEYVEFCLESGIPSRYQRMTLRDGVQTSCVSLHVNCGGHFPAWKDLDRPEIIERIMYDPRNYLIWAEQYDVEKRRIQSGRSITKGFSGPEQTTTLEYLYSEQGKLQRVVRQWPNGERITDFAARSKLSMKLSTRLSERIAMRAMEVLRQANFDSPLILVELSYRSLERYVPDLLACPAANAPAQLFPVVEMNSKRWLELDEEDFAPDITDFTQRLAETERWQAGAKMLREAARLITKLEGGVPVVDRFIAFAIDWEFEEHNIVKILKACGAEPEWIHAWKQSGWI